MRAPAVVVCIALLGCNPKPTMIVGGVSAVFGTILIATAPPPGCDKPSGICLFGTPHDNAVDGGTLFILVGVVFEIVGLIQLGRQNAEQPITATSVGVAAPPPPFTVTAEPPPEFVDPADNPEPPPVPGIPQPPLPAASLSYDNPTQRQFAFQASSAARRGRCAAAIASGKQLSIETDQKLLAADAAYARCVANH